MNNMIFKKKFLPQNIVKECLKYYEQNDIFLNKSKEYFELKQHLLNFKKISYEDMEKFIVNTRGSNYTKFYRNNNYKSNSPSCTTDIYFKSALYIKPNLWNEKLHIDLIEVFKNIKKDNLIIDLRGCTGGYLKQCLNICNLLLSKCEITFLEYKDKLITYYADEYKYQFKKIFILVDKTTASSAEILAYSLYANLNNLVLIGEKTYGKIFGQNCIINKKYKFCFMVTSFKWHIDNFYIEKTNIIYCDNPLSKIESLLFST